MQCKKMLCIWLKMWWKIKIYMIKIHKNCVYVIFYKNERTFWKWFIWLKLVPWWNILVLALFHVFRQYHREENVLHKGTIVKKILSDSFNIFTCKQVLLLSTLNFLKKSFWQLHIQKYFFNSSVWRRHLYLHILFWVQEIINFTPPKQNIDDNCEERNCYPGVVSKFM